MENKVIVTQRLWKSDDSYIVEEIVIMRFDIHKNR